MHRAGIAALLSLALTAAGAAADDPPARVVDVRLGVHADYTRIVFELTEPAGYAIGQAELPTSSGPVTELVVKLEATGAFAFGRRKGLVESVRVKPEGAGGVARVRLTVARPRIADMVLTNPPRIVIDVSPAGAAPAKAPQKAEAKPAPKPVVPPPPPPAPRAAEPPPILDSSPGAAPRPPADVPPPAPPRGFADAKPPPPPPRSGALRGPGLPPPGAEEPSPSAEAGRPGDRDPLVAETPGRRPPPAAPPPRPPKRAPLGEEVIAEAEIDEPSDSGGWSGYLVAALIAVLFVAWRLLRGRSRKDTGLEADAYPPLPPVDGIGDQPEPVVEAGPDTDLPAEPSVGAADVQPPPSASSESGPDTGFAVPAPEPGPAGSGGPQQMPLGAAAVAAGAAAAAATDEKPEPASRDTAEMERRLRHLETRLEEMADARERAERQLAAHTEELRVQRSAIARAQRVLRTLARPDEPSEPVPRDPGRSPGR